VAILAATAILPVILNYGILTLLLLRAMKTLTSNMSKLTPHLPLALTYELRCRCYSVLAAVFNFDILTLLSLRVIKTWAWNISKLTPYVSLQLTYELRHKSISVLAAKMTAILEFKLFTSVQVLVHG